MTATAMTLEECAEELQVSTRDISAEIHAGRLPALRIGRRYRVRRADFEAWQEAQVAAQTQRMAEPRIEILPPYRSGRKARPAGDGVNANNKEGTNNEQVRNWN